ncbi:MAG: hypothetical protein HQL32_15790 [Planctomycetes bacterium]|nr:hypothetical protein [Planctomycetota bacterium]
MHKCKVNGSVIFLLGAVFRLSARWIAWPSNAGWGSQVEAAPFYANQLSLEFIANCIMMLGIGVILIGVWETKSVSNKNLLQRLLSLKNMSFSDIPTDLSPEEVDLYIRWIEKDPARKFLPIETRLESFRNER